MGPESRYSQHHAGYRHDARTELFRGQIVGILGPGGEWHYYAHLDAFAPLQIGQWIDAGTVLGYVGDSGNAKGTPPHLHYGIYGAQGGALNPYPLLTTGARDRRPWPF